MAYTDDQIRRQLRLGEDNAWEFKSVEFRHDELAGRLNPILDTNHRTYLYASNIAVNEGQQQPVSFVPGTEELHLMDATGLSLLVRVVAIAGRSSLLEYGPA